MSAFWVINQAIKDYDIVDGVDVFDYCWNKYNEMFTSYQKKLLKYNKELNEKDKKIGFI